jgi:hypothetical protein
MSSLFVIWVLSFGTEAEAALTELRALASKDERIDRYWKGKVTHDCDIFWKVVS